ncbi:hypothetical protein C7401_103375 [Paraburkholderia unamae]|uniref:hypothetical protein n=1 Tax=Paraburkholderia unamae TaxID=219649 RepID=UPI000DC339C5|nr:hypothetical protein [Paraburkholderia unamae]RAR66068.1 hypothetical protein C7401_103375 [Paraburkholderia unamae]
MNAKLRALPFALALFGTSLITGCVTDARVVAGPARATAVVAAPPPPPVVVAQPVYVPQQYDAYVSVALDRDIVYTGGSTYIWIVGSDGHRQRHYYGHGDLRGEVLHRRSELRVVMAHNEGHLPMQRVHMAEPPARVRVTMQPHGHRPPPAGHPPAHAVQAASHRPPPPIRSADAGRHRRPEGHPESHPNAAPAPRFAGQPPHAG